MEYEDSKTFEWNELDKAGLFIFNLGMEYGFFNNMGIVYCNKKILVPFKFEKTDTSTEDSSGSSEKKEPDSQLIKNILLSGLSLGVKISF